MLDNDYGPGTKILGLLNSNILLNNIKNLYIILIDDDLIYKPYMIEYFDNNIKLNNIEVASYWVYDNNNIKIGQGSDGFLIKSDKLNNFVNYYNIIKDYDYINYHDDYYISYYFKLINISIEYIKPPHNCLIYNTHNDTFTDALCNLKGKYDRNILNIKIYEILNNLNNNGKFDFKI